MTAVIVDTTTLLKVIGSSLVAGVGVAAVFALAVFGATRSSDRRRAERRAAASAYGLLALTGVAVCAGAIAYGIVLTTQKG